MKLSHLFAKLTLGSTKAFTILGGLALAGAALTAASPAAHAQQFGVGVQFGEPRYVEQAPPPVVYRSYAPEYATPRYGETYGYAPGYWEHRRYEQWRAHEYWEQRREREWNDRRFHYRDGWR